MADEPLSDAVAESEGSKKKEKKEKKKEKKNKADKETKYAHLAEGSSADEESGKSTSKTVKKAKGFKFVSSKREKEESKRSQSKHSSSSNNPQVASTQDVLGESHKGAKKRAKIFKSHHSGKHHHHDHSNEGSQGSMQQGVFGVPLALAVSRDRSHDGIALPVAFRVCIDHLEAHGLDQEGIYRASGLKSKVKKLRDALNSRSNVDLSDFEPSVVASVLKQFLRELPEPILTKNLETKFEATADLRSNEQQIEQLKSLHQQLPECNRLLFDYTLLHMMHVISKERVNKMSLQNVCIVLSPTLQISHPLLACLFKHARELLEGVFIKKYTAPLTGADVIRRLPSSVSGIEEEMVKQESMLAELHSQISSGTSNKRSEEQIWEHQRVVTELRRRLRVAKREELAVGTSSKCFEPIEYEEDINFDLQTPRSARRAVAVNKQAQNEVSGIKINSRSEEGDSKVNEVNDANSEVSTGNNDSSNLNEVVNEKKGGSENKRGETNQMSSTSLMKEEVNYESIDATEEEKTELKPEGDICTPILPKTSEMEEMENNPTSTLSPSLGPSGSTQSQIIVGDHVSSIEVVDGPKNDIDVSAKDASELQGAKEEVLTRAVGPHVTIINLEQQLEPESSTNSGTKSPTVSKVPSMTDEAVQTEVVDDTSSSSKRIQFNVESKSSFPILLPKPPAPNRVRISAQHGSNNNRVMGPVSSKERALMDNDRKPERQQGRQKSKSLPRGVLPSDLSRFDSNNDVIKDRDKEDDLKMRESEAVLLESLRLQFEHEELLTLKKELERRRAREMEEVEELREELASMQTLYQYRTCSVDSSESSSEETSSAMPGSKEALADSMTQTLANLVRENRELEATRLSLSDKIEEERKACLDLRVQIRLEQEKIRMRKEGTAFTSSSII